MNIKENNSSLNVMRKLVIILAITFFIAGLAIFIVRFSIDVNREKKYHCEFINSAFNGKVMYFDFKGRDGTLILDKDTIATSIITCLTGYIIVGDSIVKEKGSGDFIVLKKQKDGIFSKNIVPCLKIPKGCN